MNIFCELDRYMISLYHGEDIWNSPHGFLPEIFYNTFTFYSRKTLLQIFMYSYQSYMDYSLSVL